MNTDDIVSDNELLAIRELADWVIDGWAPRHDLTIIQTIGILERFKLRLWHVLDVDTEDETETTEPTGTEEKAQT